ncbi:MAG: DUF992 domain-containing protein [Sphingomonadales bacterium]|nr:DUF992 domain-containing protein [Sphingomonadales bacterium]
MSGAEQKPAVAPDDPMIIIGTLTCNLMGEGNSASSGVGREMICRFQPGLHGPAEVYTGSVQGVGKADLLFGKGAVLLSVKAPQSTEIAPGLLAQSYAVDAAASGSAFAPLIGDRKKLIVLQPQMEQEGRVAEGKSQPEAVIIVVELKLQSTPA